MNAIFCKAIEPIPAMVDDVPGRGQVERLKFDGGKLAPTGERFEAINIGRLICPGATLQAKFIDGVLAIDVEVNQDEAS